MKTQYCKVCKSNKLPSEFYDEKKGYHGNRDWCKACASEYGRKRNATNRKLLRKLIRFWNEHHPNNQIPLPR